MVVISTMVVDTMVVPDLYSTAWALCETLRKPAIILMKTHMFHTKASKQVFLDMLKTVTSFDTFSTSNNLNRQRGSAIVLQFETVLTRYYTYRTLF